MYAPTAAPKDSPLWIVPLICLAALLTSTPRSGLLSGSILLLLIIHEAVPCASTLALVFAGAASACTRLMLLTPGTVPVEYPPAIMGLLAAAVAFMGPDDGRWPLLIMFLLLLYTIRSSLQAPYYQELRSAFDRFDESDNRYKIANNLQQTGVVLHTAATIGALGAPLLFILKPVFDKPITLTSANTLLVSCSAIAFEASATRHHLYVQACEAGDLE